MRTVFSSVVIALVAGFIGGNIKDVPGGFNSEVQR